LQKVLEVKNKGLADQQKAAAAASAPVAPVASAPATPAAPAAVAAASALASAPEVKAEAPAPAAKPAVVAAKRKVLPPPPPPESSLLDTLLGNPLIAGGAAALLVGLGAFGIYSRRRKQKPFGDSIINDSSLKANSLFGSTGGQSVDTNNSVFNSNFAPSASQLDSNEVDPVAEADVYIAYGRDAQAEEILKEALRTQPDRHAVRVKLLEIYSNRKDVRSFEVLASELYALTKGDGKDWQHAAALGQALDPNNPLYASGKLDPTTIAPAQAHDEGHGDMVADAHALEESSTSYFGGTTVAPREEQQLLADVHAAHQQAATAEHSLDFDLDGIDSEHMEQPDAGHVPVAESKEPAHMDFDLGEPEEHAHAEESEALAMHVPSVEPEPALPEFDIPSLPKIPETPAVHTPAPASLDFDLSGISLELNPEEKSALNKHEAEASIAEHHLPEIGEPEHAPLEMHVPEIHSPALGHAESELLPDLGMHMDAGGVDLDTGVDGEYSNNAEMATKLDLAAAYHEIGDKEGARELLDEVIKGGTPEQLEKAHSLLAKLG
jgi:pilus assembly protein FimV